MLFRWTNKDFHQDMVSLWFCLPQASWNMCAGSELGGFQQQLRLSSSVWHASQMDWNGSGSMESHSLTTPPILRLIPYIFILFWTLDHLLERLRWSLSCSTRCQFSCPHGRFCKSCKKYVTMYLVRYLPLPTASSTSKSTILQRHHTAYARCLWIPFPQLSYCEKDKQPSWQLRTGYREKRVVLRVLKEFNWRNTWKEDDRQANVSEKNTLVEMDPSIKQRQQASVNEVYFDLDD